MHGPAGRGVRAPLAAAVRGAGTARARGLGSYIVSLPERVVRSAVGVGAGATREVSEVALPAAVRDSHLYRNLFDAMLRYAIETVGGVENVYGPEGELPDRFLARRTLGNAVELGGVVAFRASPVWVLAALADLAGAGRRLIPELAAALAEQGLLEADREFTSVDQMLDGLERTAGRVADTINTPPVRVDELRAEWAAIREAARGVVPARLPSPGDLQDVWRRIREESARQGRSAFATSSLLAVAVARSGAVRTGRIVSGSLLDHYRASLDEMRATGYLAFSRRQLKPYARAVAKRFSPEDETWTERALARIRRKRAP